MKKLALLLLLGLAACSQQPMMTLQYYDTIDIGADIMEIEREAGEPYEVKPLPNGIAQYIYIQRVWRDKDCTDQRHYYLMVEDGKIIEKHWDREPCPIDIYIHN
ncbi:MAG: hypothetical protein ACQEP8_05445 [Chlamydiota bacterium]